MIQAIERARAQAAPAGQSAAGADALIHIAAIYLQTPDASQDKSPSPEVQIVVHLDHDLGVPGGALSASLDDGTYVSAEALRRVACDGGLVAAVIDERAGVLDVGRRTRAIPTAIKRALWLRDAGCRFPGCANRRFVHGHHVRHWLHGGRTALDNLVLLCTFHHRLVHEGGFTVALTHDAHIEVRTPAGAKLPAVPDVAPDGGAVEWEGDWWTAGDRFAPPLPTWTGEPVDYDEAVAVLAAA